MDDNTNASTEVASHHFYSDEIMNSTLEDRIRAYAHAWVNGARKQDAYRQAGYKCATPSNAAVFHRRYQAEIDKVVMEEIQGKAAKALQVLEEIMLHGKSETARTKAALEILDRGGYGKETKIQIGHDQPKSKEELQSQLLALLATNSKEIKFLEGDS